MQTKKFRAWDKEGKEMFRVVGVYFPHENSKSQDIIVNGRGGSVNIKPKHLMQFTGLLDKNREEIYEGYLFIRPGRKYIDVVIDIRNFACKYEKYEGTILVEIIGNIYENPELLPKE